MEIRIKKTIPAYRYTGDKEALWLWIRDQINSRNTSGNNCSLSDYNTEDWSVTLRHGPGMFAQYVSIGTFVVCCPFSNHLKIFSGDGQEMLNDPKYDKYKEELQKCNDMFHEKFEIIE